MLFQQKKHCCPILLIASHFGLWVEFSILFDSVYVEWTIIRKLSCGGFPSWSVSVCLSFCPPAFLSVLMPFQAQPMNYKSGESSYSGCSTSYRLIFVVNWFLLVEGGSAFHGRGRRDGGDGWGVEEWSWLRGHVGEWRRAFQSSQSAGRFDGEWRWRTVDGRTMRGAAWLTVDLAHCSNGCCLLPAVWLELECPGCYVLIW